jgi:hypothetical protein
MDDVVKTMHLMMRLFMFLAPRATLVHNVKD